MAFIPWPHGAKAVFKWHHGLVTWNNVMAFSKVNFTYPDMVELSSTMEAGIRTSYKDLMPTAVYFDGIDVIDMRSEGAAEYVTPYGGTHGTTAYDILSFHTALLITLRTAKRGRAFRGRIYLAGFNETGLVNGVWDSGYVSEAISQVTAWAAEALLAGWTQCVASERFNKAWRQEAEMNPVTGWEVRSTLPGHQRRRDRRP